MHPVVLIVCIIVAVLGIAAIVFGIHFLNTHDKKHATSPKSSNQHTRSQRKSKASAEETLARERAWANAKRRFHDSVDCIKSYSTNLQKALQYPAMNDNSDTYIKNAHRRKDEAQAILYRHDGVEAPPQHTVEEFVSAVEIFEHAVNFAEENAQAVGIRRFGYLTAKDIRKAQKLLHRLDVNSPFGGSREDKLHKIEDLIESINNRNDKIVIPVEATLSLHRVGA